MVAWETVIAPEAHFHVCYMRARQGPLFRARSPPFLSFFLSFFCNRGRHKVIQPTQRTLTMSLSLTLLFSPPSRTCRSARNISILLMTSISREDELALYDPMSSDATISFNSLSLSRTRQSSIIRSAYLSLILGSMQ